jgi:Tol biopolymer transport system component
VVKDLVTGKTRNLGRGLYPSWSPDGEWLAITREDGLYVMRRDGRDTRKVLEVTDWWNIERASLDPLRAMWSPDGDWLVYHKIYKVGEIYNADIYKLNVNTGEELKLAEGGANPHWRWDPKPMPPIPQRLVLILN